MSTTLRSLIVQRIRDSGPLTVAEYMDLALYHPVLGYYSHTRRPTGRAGDFFTSVDVGPQFGALLAAQLNQMYRLLVVRGTPVFELVEVGASNAQLARDILDTTEEIYPDLYAAIRLTLVETSKAARAAQRETLGHHQKRLSDQLEILPDQVCGVILTNELLDALPTHAVTMTLDGLRELFVGLSGDRLVQEASHPSTPELDRYIQRLDFPPLPGWRGEINLAAVNWIRSAARQLKQGFIIVIDYGRSAEELYSNRHDGGTLTTYYRHIGDATGTDPQQLGGPTWLNCPGEQDITSHVDLTSIQTAAQEEGLDELGLVDQTRFLLGLGALGLPCKSVDSTETIKHRLALKTLLVPGSLGSTHKVLLLSKQMGQPQLLGCSFHMDNETTWIKSTERTDISSDTKST